MRTRLSFVITIPVFFILTFLVLFARPTNVHAQIPTVSCFIQNVYFNGSDQPPTTAIPTNTDFYLKITCTSFPSPPENVSVTFNGVTKTLNGLTAALNTSFGSWNFPSATSGGVTFTIPGETVTCTSTCTVHMNEGPVATTLPPVPDTDCPASFSYNPAPPQLNQPFQVIFLIPESIHGSLNGDTAPVNYRFVYISQPGDQMGDYPLIVDNGRWVVSYPAVSGSTNWSLLETVENSTPTCLSDDPFENNSGDPGKNPCIDTDGDGKVDSCPTAIGLIPTNLGDFATAVLRIALGISGGIVLILMVIGSIRVMTSSGDPKNVAAGRDMIIAAITGALFIAFSVMIMQFLGTAVVPIPGLVFGT